MAKITRSIDTQTVLYTIVDVVDGELREGQTLVKNFPANYKEEKIRKQIQKQNPGLNVIIKKITKETGKYEMELEDFIRCAIKVEEEKPGN